MKKKFVQKNVMIVSLIMKKMKKFAKQVVILNLKQYMIMTMNVLISVKNQIIYIIMKKMVKQNVLLNVQNQKNIMKLIKLV